MNASEFSLGLFIRGVAPPLRLADYRLVAFYMDSTLVNVENIDEIAALAGRVFSERICLHLKLDFARADTTARWS